jgi:hypothetical protein
MCKWISQIIREQKSQSKKKKKRYWSRIVLSAANLEVAVLIF